MRHQELYEQIPELIQLDEDKKMKVNYNGLISVLLSELKNSNEKIKTLEERLENIEIILNNSKN